MTRLWRSVGRSCLRVAGAAEGRARWRVREGIRHRARKPSSSGGGGGAAGSAKVVYRCAEERIALNWTKKTEFYSCQIVNLIIPRQN